ncbi:protein-L-isoaspartate O-methyltransferase [Dokdonella soli]|uniref:Protein-L-isoaspartate O-methyltransferase n=1 Tax=Dokdonella soli TaxID=529810 RepID=A0ABP3TZ50_9GAMM
MLMNTELARQNMVENQVRTWEVLDARVLDTLGAVRREDFVPARHRALAFADLALPIGHGEVMLKPTIEGRILQALALAPGERVLEIGTGSGFLTACLARLAGSVVSVEQHADLAEAARANLAAAQVRNARIEVADAIRDFSPGESFDAVVVGAAVYALPESFQRWVKPGGRLFAVVGESPAMQATLYTHPDETHWLSESLFETDLPYLRNAEPPRRFTL